MPVEDFFFFAYMYVISPGLNWHVPSNMSDWHQAFNLNDEKNKDKK